MIDHCKFFFSFSFSRSFSLSFFSLSLFLSLYFLSLGRALTVGQFVHPSNIPPKCNNGPRLGPNGDQNFDHAWHWVRRQPLLAMVGGPFYVSRSMTTIPMIKDVEEAIVVEEFEIDSTQLAGHACALCRH